MSCMSHFQSGATQRHEPSHCTRRIISLPASDLDRGACPFSMAPPDQKYPVYS